MNLILAYFVCVFNIYGLLFFMSDTGKSIDVLKKMNCKAKVCLALAVFAVAAGTVYLGDCLVAFLVLEYAGLLLWYRKEQKEYLGPALRGISSIILLVFVELSILFTYYYLDIKNPQHTGKLDFEIKIACYLGMALVQCLLALLLEMKKIAAGYRLSLMAILGLKNVGDLIWLYVCVSSSMFQNSQILVSFLFIAEIIINYHALCIMTLRMEERYTQKKREDIHVNAYEYYLNMEEEHLRIRKMYHEMKNQMMIMKEGEGYADEDRMKYGENLEARLEEMNHFYHTGIPSLDILLFDGRKRAEAKGIEFEAVVEEGCLLFMAEEDVNIIFSNAIINAIEACDKIREGSKQIRIKAGKNLDDILIYIKNTVSQEHEKGKLSTSKRNRVMHGIGLTSIQESVEKYNGYVSIIEEDGTFLLAILFGKG